jgi:hypothetical protein
LEADELHPGLKIPGRNFCLIYRKDSLIWLDQIFIYRYNYSTNNYKCDNHDHHSSDNSIRSGFTFNSSSSPDFLFGFIVCHRLSLKIQGIKQKPYTLVWFFYLRDSPENGKKAIWRALLIAIATLR